MSKQYRIGIIGTGNMAYFLGKKLRFSAFPVRAVYGRDAQAGRSFARAIDAVFIPDIHELAKVSDVLFLAVNDDAIASVAATLESYADKMVVHHSGTQPLENLSRYFKKSGVFWPIYSINRLQIPEHRDIPIIINAETFNVQSCLSQIAAEITNHYEVVPEEKRRVLHLMAVMTNNFMNHLAAITQDLGREQDLLFEWVLPIIRQTMGNMQTNNIAALQTGPAVRNDQSTMNNHLSLLAGHPEWQVLYKTLSQSIIDYHKSQK